MLLSPSYRPSSSTFLLSPQQSKRRSLPLSAQFPSEFPPLANLTRHTSDTSATITKRMIPLEELQSQQAAWTVKEQSYLLEIAALKEEIARLRSFNQPLTSAIHLLTAETSHLTATANSMRAEVEEDERVISTPVPRTSTNSSTNLRLSISPASSTLHDSREATPKAGEQLHLSTLSRSLLTREDSTMDAYPLLQPPLPPLHPHNNNINHSNINSNSNNSSSERIMIAASDSRSEVEDRIPTEIDSSSSRETSSFMNHNNYSNQAVGFSLSLSHSFSIDPHHHPNNSNTNNNNNNNNNSNHHQHGYERKDSNLSNHSDTNIDDDDKTPAKHSSLLLSRSTETVSFLQPPSQTQHRSVTEPVIKPTSDIAAAAASYSNDEVEGRDRFSRRIDSMEEEEVEEEVVELPIPIQSTLMQTVIEPALQELQQRIEQDYYSSSTDPRRKSQLQDLWKLLTTVVFAMDRSSNNSSQSHDEEHDGNHPSASERRANPLEDFVALLTSSYTHSESK